MGKGLRFVIRLREDEVCPVVECRYEQDCWGTKIRPEKNVFICDIFALHKMLKNVAKDKKTRAR